MLFGYSDGLQRVGPTFWKLIRAYLDHRDANHDRASAVVADMAAAGVSLYTTWDVIGETVTLLRCRKSFRAALAFLVEVKPQFRVVVHGDRVRDAAQQVFRRYGRDHRLSLCNASSLVVVTTLLDRAPCLSFDVEFRRLGLSVIF